MKRFILAAFPVAFTLALTTTPAMAQNIYPYQAPRYGPGWQTPLSPYLNLLLPGNTAVNYYGLVEPLFQARQFGNITTQTLQGILNQFPEPPGIMAEDLNASLTATGHPTAINYTGSRFSTLTGLPFVSEGAFAQRRMGMGGGMGGQMGYRGGMGATGMGGMGMGGMGMGGMGMGGMGMGGMGMGGMGAGVWPNMRTGMGGMGR
jgi:hypothetical protein